MYVCADILTVGRSELRPSCLQCVDYVSLRACTLDTHMTTTQHSTHTSTDITKHLILTCTVQNLSRCRDSITCVLFDATKVQYSTFSIIHRSSSLEFEITGYYDPVWPWHAGSQDNDLSCHLPIYILTVRCNIYISCLCYDVSVCLSVTEVHWRIIANLGLKFRSKFTAHCGRGER